jgi:Zn finger protein HypA/HybF involved in hydrogenase expression
MPFQGVWTLRCQNCGGDFTLELHAGEEIVNFAQNYLCPHCKKTPRDLHTGRNALSSWHHVLEFHAKKI